MRNEIKYSKQCDVLFVEDVRGGFIKEQEGVGKDGGNYFDLMRLWV